MDMCCGPRWPVTRDWGTAGLDSPRERVGVPFLKLRATFEADRQALTFRQE